MKIYSTIIISLILLSSISLSQVKNNAKYIFETKEFLDIMNKSKITYEIKMLEDTAKLKKEECPVLSNQYYIKNDGDTSITLFKYELSDSAEEAYDKAEKVYVNGNYDEAFNLYKKVLDIDTSYNKIYTMLGDMYYMKKNYDSAKYYFNFSIEKNFVDYTAHWFLADTYAKLDEYDKAVQEITIAHMLNRNHADIFMILKKYKKMNGKEWKDWEITPMCLTYKDGDKVVVEMEKEWLGYACADAVWKYEPDFAKNIIGKDYTEEDISYEKEASCIAANIVDDSMKRVRDIIEDGYFQEMVLYERFSKKVPAALLLLPKDKFDRVIEYINKYH